MKRGLFNLITLSYALIPFYANASNYDCLGGGDNIQHCIPLINFTNKPIYTSVPAYSCTDGSEQGFNGKIIPAATPQGSGIYAYIMGLDSGCSNHDSFQSNMKVDYYDDPSLSKDSFIGSVYYEMDGDIFLDKISSFREQMLESGPGSNLMYIHLDPGDYSTSFLPFEN